MKTPKQMMLLTKANRKALPGLYGQEEAGNEAIAYVKFFTPDSNWTWYATEFDGEDTFFGLVSGFEVELGYFTLHEFVGQCGPMGIPIERDRYFKPTSLAKLMELHGRSYGEPEPEPEEVMPELDAGQQHGPASRPMSCRDCPPGLTLVDCLLCCNAELSTTGKLTISTDPIVIIEPPPPDEDTEKVVPVELACPDCQGTGYIAAYTGGSTTAYTCDCETGKRQFDVEVEDDPYHAVMHRARTKDRSKRLQRIAELKAARAASDETDRLEMAGPEWDRQEKDDPYRCGPRN